jgi:hypothetical protein
VRPKGDRIAQVGSRGEIIEGPAANPHAMRGPVERGAEIIGAPLLTDRMLRAGSSEPRIPGPRLRQGGKATPSPNLKVRGEVDKFVRFPAGGSNTATISRPNRLCLPSYSLPSRIAKA